MKMRSRALPALVFSLSIGSAFAQEPLPGKDRTLAAAMPVYGVSAHRIQTALWRDDYVTVANEARSIVQRAGLSREERERMRAKFNELPEWLIESDAKVFRAAMAIAGAADKKDTAQIVKALGAMQEGCTACHTNYRARVRAK